MRWFWWRQPWPPGRRWRPTCSTWAAREPRRVWNGLASLETVTVGNPGNAADTRYETPGYGCGGLHVQHRQVRGDGRAVHGVPQRRGRHGHLRAVQHEHVDRSGYGCKIQRSGSSGSYTYSVAADWANRPVNYVSWGDAARFANWLHNGQPTGARTWPPPRTGRTTSTARRRDAGPSGRRAARPTGSGRSPARMSGTRRRITRTTA